MMTVTEPGKECSTAGWSDHDPLTVKTQQTPTDKPPPRTEWLTGSREPAKTNTQVVLHPGNTLVKQLSMTVTEHPVM